MGSWSESWHKATIWHRVGQGCSSQISSLPRSFRRPSLTWTLPCVIRQFWGHGCLKQWSFLQLGDKCYSKEYLHHISSARNPFNSNICPKLHQHSGCVIQRRHSSLFERLPPSMHPFLPIPPRPSFPAPCTSPIMALPFFGTSFIPQDSAQLSPGLCEDIPSLHPNYELHPKCQAEEHIFLWKSINTPPPSVIDVKITDLACIL